MVIKIREKDPGRKNQEIRCEELTIDLTEEEVTIEASGIEIFFDEELQTDYGENWAGLKYTAEGILRMAVARYLNGDTAEFVVPDKLKEVKERFFEPFMEVDGRTIPKKIVDLWGNTMEVSYVDEECSLYEETNSVLLISNKTGEVITDIEALAFDYKEENAETGEHKVLFGGEA